MAELLRIPSSWARKAFDFLPVPSRTRQISLGNLAARAESATRQGDIVGGVRFFMKGEEIRAKDEKTPGLPKEDET